MANTNNNSYSRFDFSTGGKQKKVCYRCKKKFKHNDLVFHKRANSHNGSRAYHKECWEKLQQ